MLPVALQHKTPCNVGGDSEPQESRPFQTFLRAATAAAGGSDDPSIGQGGDAEQIGRVPLRGISFTSAGPEAASQGNGSRRASWA